MLEINLTHQHLELVEVMFLLGLQLHVAIVVGLNLLRLVLHASV